VPLALVQGQEHVKDGQWQREERLRRSSFERSHTLSVLDIVWLTWIDHVKEISGTEAKRRLKARSLQPPQFHLMAAPSAVIG
jgi:hypothetical protein